MMQSPRDQTVRRNNLRRMAIRRGVNRHGVLSRIQFMLRFDGAAHLFVIIG